MLCLQFLVKRFVSAGGCAADTTKRLRLNRDGRTQLLIRKINKFGLIILICNITL